MGDRATQRPPDADTRARTHLANERTFLAWLRTGLSLIALGIGAAKLLGPNLVPGFPLSMLFSVMVVSSGIAMVMLGGDRYRQSRRQIDSGTFEPPSRAILVTAALGVFGGAVAVVVVFLLQ